MKKIIIKTAIITFCMILICTAILHCIFALFFPKSLSKFYKKLNNNSMAVKYMEREYIRSSDFDTLTALCELVDEHKDGATAEEYISLMLSADNEERFADYCGKADLNGASISTREFYNAKLVIAIYSQDRQIEAIHKAEELIKKNGYTQNNPFYLLILDCGEKLSDSEKSEIENCIEELKESLTESEKTFAEKDLDLLHSLQSKTE